MHLPSQQPLSQAMLKMKSSPIIKGKRSTQKTSHPNKNSLQKQFAQTLSACFLLIQKRKGGTIFTKCPEIVCANCALIFGWVFFWGGSPLHEGDSRETAHWGREGPLMPWCCLAFSQLLKGLVSGTPPWWKTGPLKEQDPWNEVYEYHVRAAMYWQRLKGKNPEGRELPKTSQKKAIFREDFEDIQKYSKIQLKWYLLSSEKSSETSSASTFFREIFKSLYPLRFYPLALSGCRLHVPLPRIRSTLAIQLLILISDSLELADISNLRPSQRSRLVNRLTPYRAPLVNRLTPYRAPKWQIWEIPFLAPKNGLLGAALGAIVNNPPRIFNSPL